MYKMSSKSFNIIIAEDDLDDVELFIRAIWEISLSVSIDVVRDGMELLDRLNDEDKTLPDIIFLDLNMPIMDGWGFLDEFVLIKPQKEIVIYIVTSSVSSADRKRALGYSETVKDYVIKPISPIRMNEIFEKYKKEEAQ